MFRHILVDGLTLTLNDVAIGPIDPLFLMPQARVETDALATQHGDALRFEVALPGDLEQTSTVEVVLSILPEEWQVRHNKDKEFLRRRHIDTTTGFSIVRARREIDLIKSPFHAKHWTDTWYRVEIRFDPELDELFGVTHTKQHAKIRAGSVIYERLRETVVANVITMKDAIVARGKKSHKVQTLRAEQIVKKVRTRLEQIRELQLKSPAEVHAEVEKYLGLLRIRDAAAAANVGARLEEYEVLIELESLPGAPFYRTQVVGRSIIVLLNTHHRFYERVYRRVEKESPEGKTGVDLLLMALGRSEVLCPEDSRDFYTDERQRWSQHLKMFLDHINDVDDQDETTTDEVDPPVNDAALAKME